MEVIKEKISNLLLNFKQPLGPAVYKVDARGNIEAWIVLDLRYEAEEFRISYSGKTPSNLEVMYVEMASKKNPIYDENRVKIVVSKMTSSGKSTQGLRMADFDGNWFFNQVTASLIAKQRKAKRDAEIASISAGNAARCEYCHKVIAMADVIVRKVPTLRYGISPHNFCSEICYENFAHSSIG
jgi:hypothetical protein